MTEGVKRSTCTVTYQYGTKTGRRRSPRLEELDNSKNKVTVNCFQCEIFTVYIQVRSTLSFNLWRSATNLSCEFQFTMNTMQVHEGATSLIWLCFYSCANPKDVSIHFNKRREEQQEYQIKTQCYRFKLQQTLKFLLKQTSALVQVHNSPTNTL